MELLSLEAKMKKTELILNNVIKLQSMPKILREILTYLNQSEVNNTKLSKMILGDQSLATKILTIANSPLFGLQRKVTTIDFAVMVLGVAEIRSIVSSLSMMEVYKNKSDEYLDQVNFWEHSYLVGCTAKSISEDLKLENSGEAFTAGFLHDLGLPVIHKYFHSAFVTIKGETESKDNYTFMQGEYDNLGLSHYEIAYRLLDKWNLPPVLCETVKFHHDPVRSENYKVLSAIVHLADYSTRQFEVGSFFWDKGLELKADAMELLGFKNIEEAKEFINKYLENAKAQIDSMRFLI